MVPGLQTREKCVRRRWRERDRRRNFVCAVRGGWEGHEFVDGGDDVVGLRRYVLCDIGGGADGCATAGALALLQRFGCNTKKGMNVKGVASTRSGSC